MKELVFDFCDKPKGLVRIVGSAVLGVFRHIGATLARRKQIYFFSLPEATVGESDKPSASNMFVEIGTWQRFYDFAKSRGFPVYRWQYDRFMSDSTVSFVALADDSTVFTYGWVTVGNRKLVAGHDMRDLPILYDFITPEAQRRKGFYTSLLMCLRFRKGGIIYAARDNVPSLRAIRNAGFRQYWPKEAMA